MDGEHAVTSGSYSQDSDLPPSYSEAVQATQQTVVEAGHVPYEIAQFQQMLMLQSTVAVDSPSLPTRVQDNQQTVDGAPQLPTPTMVNFMVHYYVQLCITSSLL